MAPLVVPVTALLAQSTGGAYAVEVVGAGASNHLVRVSLGLFDDADGLVAVTGSGLVAGQESGGRVNVTDTPPPIRQHRGRWARRDRGAGARRRRRDQELSGRAAGPSPARR